MKHILKNTSIVLFFVLFGVNNICMAQDLSANTGDDYQKHRGFYLSMAGGLNSTNLNTVEDGEYDLTFTGSGGLFDIKIGGAIIDNLILHATLTSKSVMGPKIKSNTTGFTDNLPNDLTIGEAMIGGGLTYYVPSNFFFSGSVGLGNFTMINVKTDETITTDRGFSMQLKVGKEWWVSKRWGLGVAITYGKTMVTNTPGGSIEEKLNSNNLGIVFNATLN